jgi:hypothetical protein
MNLPGISGPTTDSTKGTDAVRVAFGDWPFWEKAIRAGLSERYAPSFVDLSRASLKDYDAVVPLQLIHYAALMRHSELRGSKFLHPSRGTVSLCNDKLKFFRFLDVHGFAESAPALRPPGPPYPYVWKKRRGWFGEQCHIVMSPQDESNLDLNDRDWFSQELVPGEFEFATHILRVRGEIRYVSTYIYKMGEGVHVKGVHDSPQQTRFMRGCLYLDLFADILARLEFEGTACIDYKVVNGRPVIFEINPRFGGSLCSDITTYLDAYVGSLVPQSTEPGFRPALLRLARRFFVSF